jgi:hypothetical protein
LLLDRLRGPGRGGWFFRERVLLDRLRGRGRGGWLFRERVLRPGGIVVVVIIVVVIVIVDNQCFKRRLGCSGFGP